MQSAGFRRCPDTTAEVGPVLRGKRAAPLAGVCLCARSASNSQNRLSYVAFNIRCRGFAFYADDPVAADLKITADLPTT